jgi:hypothetical protein
LTSLMSKPSCTIPSAVPAQQQHAATQIHQNPARAQKRALQGGPNTKQSPGQPAPASSPAGRLMPLLLPSAHPLTWPSAMEQQLLVQTCRQQQRPRTRQKPCSKHCKLLMLHAQHSAGAVHKLSKGCNSASPSLPRDSSSSVLLSAKRRHSLACWMRSIFSTCR